MVELFPEAAKRLGGTQVLRQKIGAGAIRKPEQVKRIGKYRLSPRILNTLAKKGSDDFFVILRKGKTPE